MAPGLLIAAIAASGVALHSAPAAVGLASEPGLRSYLRQALRSDTDVRYRIGAADLNGDGADELVVYVTSPEYCGSGGCAMLVLQRTAQGYRTRMKATVTRLPIRFLKTRTNGWHDIGVTVAGGGTSPREVAMRFDGRRYPSNPTLAPTATAANRQGRALISGAGEE
jgi:hypothetical protein